MKADRPFAPETSCFSAEQTLSCQRPARNNRAVLRVVPLLKFGWQGGGVFLTTDGMTDLVHTFEGTVTSCSARPMAAQTVAQDAPVIEPHQMYRTDEAQEVARPAMEKRLHITQ